VQGVRITALVTSGITAYELLQPVLPRGVLDWKDVASTPVAGLISLVLLLLICRVVPDPLSADREDATIRQEREADYDGHPTPGAE
jgi:hypothetical protein